MKNLHFLFLFLLGGLLGGCASTYKPIYPKAVSYSTGQSSPGLHFGYRHDLLRTTGNKKYAKKEDKRGVRLVAIKITNNTGSTLTYPDDFNLLSSDRSIYQMDPASIHTKLKQGVPVYLLYLLFTPFSLYTHDATGAVTSETPIGLFLGPGLTGLNMGMAASANKNFLDELKNYNLNNLQIKDGETVYGLIGMPDAGFAPLSLELKVIPEVEYGY